MNMINSFQRFYKKIEEKIDTQSLVQKKQEKESKGLKSFEKLIAKKSLSDYGHTFSSTLNKHKNYRTSLEEKESFEKINDLELKKQKHLFMSFFGFLMEVLDHSFQNQDIDSNQKKATINLSESLSELKHKKNFNRLYNLFIKNISKEETSNVSEDFLFDFKQSKLFNDLSNQTRYELESFKKFLLKKINNSDFLQNQIRLNHSKDFVLSKASIDIESVGIKVLEEFKSNKLNDFSKGKGQIMDSNPTNLKRYNQNVMNQIRSKLSNNDFKKEMDFHGLMREHVNQKEDFKVNSKNFLNPMEQQEFDVTVIDQLIRNLHFINKSKGYQEVNIQLKPDFLGKILIKVYNQNGIYRANIFVDNHYLKQYFQDQAEILKTQFEGLNLELSELEIGFLDEFEKREEFNFSESLKDNWNDKSKKSNLHLRQLMHNVSEIPDSELDESQLGLDHWLKDVESERINIFI